jgi:hypothetical protein
MQYLAPNRLNPLGQSSGPRRTDPPTNWNRPTINLKIPAQLLINCSQNPGVRPPAKRACERADTLIVTRRCEPTARMCLPNHLNPDKKTQYGKQHSDEIRLLPEPICKSCEQCCQEDPSPPLRFMNWRRRHCSRCCSHTCAVERQKLSRAAQSVNREGGLTVPIGVGSGELLSGCWGMMEPFKTRKQNSQAKPPNVTVESDKLK